MRESSSNILARWRIARRAVLGSIVLAGTVATSAAIVRQSTIVTCERRVDHSYTYSGVGVVIEREGEDIVIKRVLPDSPAMGKLHVGARLVSVDGQVPGDLEAWASAIRGAPGTTVELQLSYPCGGEKTIAVERDVIRMQMGHRGF